MTTGLAALYRSVRRRTEALCEPLETEDFVVQTLPEASPAKWHLAHTSWFFETFVLAAGLPGYRPLDPRYAVLFNSYYHAVGDQHPRGERGHLSRPTVAEVFAYRRHVDAAMERWIASGDPSPERAFAAEVGLNHEEQHQELLLTDVKLVLALNPLHPAYRDGPGRAGHPIPHEWRAFPGGPVEIGHAGPGFAFDNEAPRHQVLLGPFELGSRLVTAGEYLEFLGAGGYDRAEWWLSDGWDARRAGGWRAPLYWEPDGDAWRVMTLGGLRPLDPHEPVCHVSYYEADAYARFRGARLPREQEWEAAAGAAPRAGNLLDAGHLHPRPLDRPPGQDAVAQLFGDVWEWTASAYAAYPGYAPFPGGLGEYNGKFMVNQMVLRGGSCATPDRHVRATYRNFFPPYARWQFSGIRLARG